MSRAGQESRNLRRDKRKTVGCNKFNKSSNSNIQMKHSNCNKVTLSFYRSFNWWSILREKTDKVGGYSRKRDIYWSD